MAAIPSGAPAGAFSRPTAPGEEAAAIAFAPLAYGEAPRIGVVGDTRVGKTHLVARFIDEYLRRSLGIVAVVDDKYPNRVQFAGQVVAEPIDLNAIDIQPEPRVVVFRGRPPDNADPDEVARWCWTLHERRRPSLLVIDELNHPLLTSYGQFRSGVEEVPRTFWKGGGANIGVIWGVQSPQEAPLPVFNQSSHIVCFKLAGHGLKMLRKQDYVDDRLAAILPTFPGDEVPPPQRGHFVILRRGKPWNGIVYRYTRT